MRYLYAIYRSNDSRALFVRDNSFKFIRKLMDFDKNVMFEIFINDFNDNSGYIWELEKLWGQDDLFLNENYKHLRKIEDFYKLMSCKEDICVPIYFYKDYLSGNIITNIAKDFDLFSYPRININRFEYQEIPLIPDFAVLVDLGLIKISKRIQQKFNFKPIDFFNCFQNQDNLFHFFIKNHLKIHIHKDIIADGIIGAKYNIDHSNFSKSSYKEW